MKKLTLIAVLVIGLISCSDDSDQIDKQQSLRSRIEKKLYTSEEEGVAFILRDGRPWLSNSKRGCWELFEAPGHTLSEDPNHLEWSWRGEDGRRAVLRFETRFEGSLTTIDMIIVDEVSMSRTPMYLSNDCKL